MIALLRLAPDRLGALPPSVWEQWAPILAAWSTASVNGAKWEDKQTLLGLADPVALEALREALKRHLEAGAATGQAPYSDNEAGFLWDDDLAATYLRLTGTAAEPLRTEFVTTLTRHAPDLARPLLYHWLANHASDPGRGCLAARLLIDHDFAGSWPALKAVFDQDRELALTALGDATTVRLDRVGIELPEDVMADMYLWLRKAFPPDEDPVFDDAHVVGPREQIAQWRDRLLSALRERGTPEAVDAIRGIADELPTERWLARTLASAQAALRRAAWEPTSLPQLLHLATDSRAVLIHDHADLLALAVRALREIQRRLTGATPESHLLWDTRSRQPKREDEISDYLARRLTDLVAGRGVAVNREVQIRRGQPSGIGERADLLLDAVSIDTHGRASVITIPVEVKGAWNATLETSILEQLVQQYMGDIGSRYGLYVVVWPDTETWDSEDPNRATVAALDRPAVRDALEAHAAALAAGGRIVNVAHLDMAYRRLSRG